MALGAERPDRGDGRERQHAQGLKRAMLEIGELPAIATDDALAHVGGDDRKISSAPRADQGFGGHPGCRGDGPTAIEEDEERIDLATKINLGRLRPCAVVDGPEMAFGAREIDEALHVLRVDRKRQLPFPGDGATHSALHDLEDFAARDGERQPGLGLIEGREGHVFRA